jgi:hypothetical protein
MGICIFLPELGFASVGGHQLSSHSREQCSTPAKARRNPRLAELVDSAAMESRKPVPQIKVPAWQCQPDGRSPVSWLVNRNTGETKWYCPYQFFECC